TLLVFVFFFNDTATTEIYTLSPTRRSSDLNILCVLREITPRELGASEDIFRSEEHTSELQSLTNLVCRLLLEKKQQNKIRASGVCRSYPRSDGHWWLSRG